jgi:hypothetical protein
MGFLLTNFFSPNYFLIGRAFPKDLLRIHKGGATSVWIPFKKFALGNDLGYF